MGVQAVFLWSDVLLWGLVIAAGLAGWWSRRDPLSRSAWTKLGKSRVGVASATILAIFLVVGLVDSLHFRERLPERPGEKPAYSVEVVSLLDIVLGDLRRRSEKTYSAPLATRAYSKEMVDRPDGTQVREFPRLKFGGAHLKDETLAADDILWRSGVGIAAGLAMWIVVALAAIAKFGNPWRSPEGTQNADEGRSPGRQAPVALASILGVLLVFAVAGGGGVALAGGYHVFGTDKVGQDVLYQVLKSVRTALVIGLVTTLVTLPMGVALGIAAGYFRGWVDDLIQYVYTTLSSIPGVLLIAAAVLMMQVIIDTHPGWFATAAERADMRLLALCMIMGMTSWTGLARLLRGEALKLAQLEYVQAAVAFGVSPARILARHILPNVMHIVIIALVMDFSGLVLAEAVLSYVGIGVDPTTISFGTMINSARLELGREPVVWWSLAGAFLFMFVLVLAANLVADAIRDAFDPRHSMVSPR